MILQQCSSMIEFDKACRLFIEKWEQSEPEFCSYFQSEWLQDDTKNWFEAYSPFLPSHNNCQEGFNNHIKRDYTLRERLPLNTFKVVLMKMVSDMSRRYNPGNSSNEVKRVRTQPNLSNQMFRDAHAWITSNVIIGEIESSTSEMHTRKYIVSSTKYLSTSSSNSIKKLKSIQDKTWEHFDDFKSNGFQMIYHVSINCDKKTCFTESICTCKHFFSHFICKHIIGLALHLNIKKRTNEMLSNVISKKQARGRASKAKKASVKQ